MSNNHKCFTVSDLIEALQDQPPDNVVVVSRFLDYSEFAGEFIEVYDRLTAENDGPPMTGVRAAYKLWGHNRPDLTYLA